MTGEPLLSVVIPTLDEASTLPFLLDDLRTLRDAVETEIVVVDGGSSDGTVELAERLGANVLSAPPGRGEQLRRGAAFSSGRWMLFLHSDSRLDESAIGAVTRFLAESTESDFTHFRLRFTESGLFLRAIEIGQTVRERLFGLVYGDQGLVVSRSLYEEAGGYPGWPVMEDVGIIDRLHAVGRRQPLNADILTSPRRYREEGPIRAWLRNIRLITRYRMGADADELAAAYPPRRGAPARGTSTKAPAGADNVVVVFLKEPVAGRVKTRLAADIGDDEALRIYRALATETVRALREGPWRTVLYVDPPEAAALDAVRTWLGSGLEVRAQQEGDLGARMATALAEMLSEADRVCIVGSDLPGITRRDLDRAFARLDHSDVVFGRATDGGYWLVGLREPNPALFSGIEWSTERVLDQSLARAADAGLEVALLPEKTDVDTLDDVPEELLAGASPP